MSTQSVWVQLYYKGKDEPEGQPIKIKPAPEDVADLKAVVLPKLDPAELAVVFVYPPDTEPPFSQANSIRPGKKLVDLIDELKNTTPPTSDDHPLIVVAHSPDTLRGRQFGVDLEQILPELLKELSISRQKRLNCWERESARTTGSQRSPYFRKKVLNFYKRKTGDKTTGEKVKCQILDEEVPIDVAKNTIIAGHIWKASTLGLGLEAFGLDQSHVNSASNGLLLTKGIESAFDNQQICFLYNILEKKLVLWVADRSLCDEIIQGSTNGTKFSDVHLKPLLCPPDCLPYRRILSWHAKLTLKAHRDQIVPDPHTSEYDQSPGRHPGMVDPISRLIEEMTSPGEEASFVDAHQRHDDNSTITTSSMATLDHSTEIPDNI